MATDARARRRQVATLQRDGDLAPRRRQAAQGEGGLERRRLEQQAGGAERATGEGDQPSGEPGDRQHPERERAAGD
jgi:hypothetical protein